MATIWRQAVTIRHDPELLIHISGIVAEGRRVRLEGVRIVRHARTDVCGRVVGPPRVHHRLPPKRENFCVAEA